MTDLHRLSPLIALKTVLGKIERRCIGRRDPEPGANSIVETRASHSTIAHANGRASAQTAEADARLAQERITHGARQ
jgi:hypothetical protein